eukprot:89187_1
MTSTKLGRTSGSTQKSSILNERNGKGQSVVIAQTNSFKPGQKNASQPAMHLYKTVHWNSNSNSNDNKHPLQLMNSSSANKYTEPYQRNYTHSPLLQPTQPPTSIALKNKKRKMSFTPNSKSKLNGRRMSRSRTFVSTMTGKKFDLLQQTKELNQLNATTPPPPDAFTDEQEQKSYHPIPSPSITPTNENDVVLNNKKLNLDDFQLDMHAAVINTNQQNHVYHQYHNTINHINSHNQPSPVMTRTKSEHVPKEFYRTKHKISPYNQQKNGKIRINHKNNHNKKNNNNKQLRMKKSKSAGVSAAPYNNKPRAASSHIPRNLGSLS